VCTHPDACDRRTRRQHLRTGHASHRA
jgi:hypothetical protein